LAYVLFVSYGADYYFSGTLYIMRWSLMKKFNLNKAIRNANKCITRAQLGKLKCISLMKNKNSQILVAF
jgi:hypothetical protein